VQFHKIAALTLLCACGAPNWWIDPYDVKYKPKPEDTGAIQDELAFKNEGINLKLKHFSFNPDAASSSGDGLFIAIVESPEEPSALLNLNDEAVHMRSLTQESPWLLWHHEALQGGPLEYQLELGNLEGYTESESQQVEIEEGIGYEARIISSEVFQEDFKSFTWEFKLRSQEEPSAYLELIHEDSASIERFGMKLAELPEEDIWLASITRSLEQSGSYASWVLTANRQWWSSSEPLLVSTQ
jgi:hypothetical protein